MFKPTLEPSTRFIIPLSPMNHSTLHQATCFAIFWRHRPVGEMGDPSNRTLTLGVWIRFTAASSEHRFMGRGSPEPEYRHFYQMCVLEGQ
jgi:hypothetical protein